MKGGAIHLSRLERGILPCCIRYLEILSQAILKEAKIWAQIGGNHKVVLFYGYSFADQAVSLVRPWYKEGNLVQYVSSHKMSTYNEPQTMRLVSRTPLLRLIGIKQPTYILYHLFNITQSNHKTANTNHKRYSKHRKL